MPLEFHGDALAQFRQQDENARAYVLPFIEEFVPLGAETSVLEVGCAEGGVLGAFLRKGCRGSGVDMNAARVEQGRAILAEMLPDAPFELETLDLLSPEAGERFHERFHVIVLKDVIEHLHDRRHFLRVLRGFLRPGGAIFFGFPPWRMPYGGHQQIATTPYGRIPYLHLLPRGLYEWVLRKLGEDEITIRELLEVHDTKLSIDQFETLLADTNFRVARRRLYLINPIYRLKFGLEPREQFPILRDLPWIRDFFTTCCYYLARPER